MKFYYFLVIGLLFSSLSTFGQETEGPVYVGEVGGMRIVPSLASRSSDLTPAPNLNKEAKDARSSRNIVVPGKDSQTEDDYYVRNRDESFQTRASRTPILVFDAAQSNSQPTDPSIGVGPDHALVVFNTGFIIYDKSGVDLTGQLNVNNIFSNGGCCDLTVTYDKAADRWVLSYLFVGSGAEIAVSDGPDPVNANWYVYSIPQINDYQKLSMWSDGYYMTDNTTSSNKVWALERDEMLAGNPSAQILGFNLPGIATSGFYSPQAINVTDDNLPAAGSAPIVYLQDDAWSGVSQDHIKIWEVDVDWATPGNSTISAPTELTTTPFISVFDGGSFSNLTQPGGGIAIDALQATIMNQAQFRKFGSHNSAVFNFVVDTDASGGELAGIRWFELRQSGDGQPWSIYQEGTYTAPDGRHAWHGSLMMDVNGNIGMGYSSMAGPTTPDPTNFRVSSYYTGRFSADPLNTMTISEELIAAGNQNIPGLRYGDYSKIDIDPNDDKTFWFINEYMNSGRKDVVGVFKIAPNFPDDLGVVSIDSPVTGTLSNDEEITVTIFNYGIDPQSNFDVTYQVDGGAVVTETFSGTLNSAESVQFTFATTADLGTVGQTYEITAATALAGDEDPANDSVTEEVTFLEPNDIGVSAITSPVSGENLSNAEDVTVTITNYGGETQSNFDVAYTIDGGSPVTETVAGPLEGNSEITYTFTQTADLSGFGSYEIVATTSLPSDSDTSNDSTTKTVTNVNCQPAQDCSLGDGIYLFEVADLSNPSGCDGGYSDFTAMTATMDPGTTNGLTIETHYGNQFVTVWIDFNDDFTFTNDEKVVDNYEIADGQGGGTYVETMDLEIPADAPIGLHMMRAKTNWNAPVPNDPCEETTYGETEDYSAIIGELGIEDNGFDENSLTIVETSKNVFDVTLTTQNIDDKMEITVFNIMGQRLVFHRMEGENGSYKYPLDLSHVSSGVYLVRVGNKNAGVVKKVIVK